MIPDTGIATVSTSGTAVQISNTPNRVLKITVKALAANSGIVYFGESDVSTTNGWGLSAGNEFEENYRELGGSVPFNSFWVDAASNGDKLYWRVVLDG